MGKIIWISAAMLFATGVSSCATNITANGFHNSGYPFLTNGEKFGVRIGMDAAEARAILGHRPMTGPWGTPPCDKLKFASDCPSGAVVDDFWSNGEYRYGDIYLIILNGKVMAISWELKLGAFVS